MANVQLASIHTRLLKSRTLLSMSNTPSAAHTGVTTESAALGTYAMPAATMGPNGILLITQYWAFTGTAAVKAIITKLGGTIVAQVSAVATATIARQPCEIFNVANQAVQKTFSSAAMVSTTINTAAAQNVTFHVQLTNAGDSATLHGWTIELLYGA